MTIRIDGARLKGRGLGRCGIMSSFRVRGVLLCGVHLGLICGKERRSWLGGAGVHENVVKVTLLHGH
jgi:hypothetical protein